METYNSTAFGTVTVTESDNGITVEFDRPETGWSFTTPNPEAEITGVLYRHPDVLPERLSTTIEDLYTLEDLTIEEIDDLIMRQLSGDNIAGYHVLEIL